MISKPSPHAYTQVGGRPLVSCYVIKYQSVNEAVSVYSAFGW